MTPQRFVFAGLILLIGGCLIAAIASTTTGDALGVTLAGIGAVLLVSAAFLAIGLSEDRDREKDDRRRERERRDREREHRDRARHERQDR